VLQSNLHIHRGVERKNGAQLGALLVIQSVSLSVQFKKKEEKHPVIFSFRNKKRIGRVVHR